MYNRTKDRYIIRRMYFKRYTTKGKIAGVFLRPKIIRTSHNRGMLHQKDTSPYYPIFARCKKRKCQVEIYKGEERDKEPSRKRFPEESVL